MPDSNNFHKVPVTNLFTEPRALQPQRYERISKSEQKALSNLLSSSRMSKNVSNNHEDDKEFHHYKTTH